MFTCLNSLGTLFNGTTVRIFLCTGYSIGAICGTPAPLELLLKLEPKNEFEPAKLPVKLLRWSRNKSNAAAFSAWLEPIEDVFDLGD